MKTHVTRIATLLGLLLAAAALHAAEGAQSDPPGGKPGSVNVEARASQAAARDAKKQSFGDSVRSAGHEIAAGSKKAAHSVVQGARKLGSKVRQKVKRSGSKKQAVTSKPQAGKAGSAQSGPTAQ